MMGWFRAEFDCTGEFAGWMTRSSYGIYVVHYLMIASIGYIHAAPALGDVRDLDRRSVHALPATLRPAATDPRHPLVRFRRGGAAINK